MSFSLYVTHHFSLAAFRILSLSLTSAFLILMCLGLGLFGFILLGALCASCTWIAFPFCGFRIFLAIISSNNFSAPFSLSLSFFSDSYHQDVSTLDAVQEAF